MVTYNLKYYYNSQPTITATETDLDVDYPYQLTFTLLTALTENQRKNLKKSQKILDHMGSTELAANLFRATQTEEKLRRDGVKGKQQANATHFAVGQKVRETIRELGGTMPEELPTPERSIKQIESALAKPGKLPKT